jgi:UDP-N-acetylmuramoyl-tripeptide--D-alanyl-D-alanine ligase
MKAILRAIVVFCITVLARWVLKKYRPRIILVSGSVGKTSTKDAITAVLQEHTSVRGSEKSYNSDTGVPLTILGCKNPWNNYWGWLSVMGEGILLLLTKNVYPKTLVLEVGADKPGDIRNMITWLFPDVVVITKLPDIPVHVEAYASPHETREEEFSPAYVLKDNGVLIYNHEDSFADEFAREVSAETFTYGMDAESDLVILDAAPCIDDDAPTGICGSLAYEGNALPFSLSGIFGTHHTHPAAAAVLVGIQEGMTFEHAVKALLHYEPPRGRGRIIPGTNETVLIDDTYNSSPIAVGASLSALSALSKKRPRVVVLGDMLELGTYASREHEAVGKHVAHVADILITIGIRARGIIEGARKEGMDEKKMFSFKHVHDALEHIEPLIPKRSLVLIKGSQSVRMEKITKALLREDIVPEDVLTRQDKEWLKR